ncbi:unnamed protein product [Prorocentrum cordatum]|uniref:Uncharacterized protein n=1 Tax=Prorocentrum cordatum TaxID=2364126 RepID=A0ABN9V5T0_9DINO|nr:unnamed protein product [Polarella glacialis]
MLSAAEGSPAWPTETLNQKKFWTSSASTSHQNDQPSLHADLPASETASFACAGRGNAHLAASKPLGELAPDGQRTEASDGLPEAPPPRELLSVGSVRCRQGGRCHPCDFFWKRSGSRCVNGQELRVLPRPPAHQLYPEPPPEEGGEAPR